MRFLILGGTAEARQLAAALVANGVDVISSLAGRVSAPSLPPGRVWVGGFGGVHGLADYLRYEAFEFCHVNAVAGVPAAVVPVLVEDGLPVGVQIAAPRAPFRDG